MNHLRLALRSLGKSPGFTAVAVLTLALGIGLSTSSFSITNTMLLRSLPYPEGDRLMRIFRTSPQSQTWSHAPANYLDLKAASTSFANMAAYFVDNCSLAEPGQPAQQVSCLYTTADFLPTLGVQPALGRSFSPDEDQPGKGAVVILNHRSWVRRFAGDPAAIGRTVRLDGENLTVIGVLPPSFEAPLVWGPIEFVRPVIIQPGHRTNRTDSWYSAVARLKPGVSVRQAQAELTLLAARLDREYPKENRNDGFRVVDLASSNMGGVNGVIVWMITGLALLVLLIACANLASLQFARAFGLHRDFAIRSALGAGRFDLMVPLLAESLVLACAGGAAGLLLASWTNGLIGRNLLINGEPGFAIPLDGHVLLFALVASVATAIIFGLAPAWLATRAPASDALKEGARGTTGGRSQQRIKSALVVGEMALAIVLVSVAAAFTLGSRQFLKRNLGWQPTGLFSGLLTLPYNRYTDDQHRCDFYRGLLDRLAILPGVEKAALATSLPVYAYFTRYNLVAEGQAVPLRGQEPLAMSSAVSPDFFAVLRLPLQQGTLFRPNLQAGDPPVAIVNESLARRFWPGENPIGRRLRLAESEQWIEVIGVVGDARMAVNLAEPESRLQIYRPLVQTPNAYFTIALRTSVPPETLVAAVRRTVADLDSDLPVQQPGSLVQIIALGMANLHVVIANLGTFAFMGLLIASIGIYGVISYLTAQRTRDIGVRIALGAQYGDVIGLILMQGTRLLAGGAVLGLLGAYTVDALLQRAMPELPMPGLWLLAAVLSLLAAITLVACYLPARRAARIDPIVALRTE
jgi:predicted permease